MTISDSGHYAAWSKWTANGFSRDGGSTTNGQTDAADAIPLFQRCREPDRQIETDLADRLPNLGRIRP